MNVIPIKTIPHVTDESLEAICSELENQGYKVVQKKKEEGDELKWTVKAKLKEPPSRPGRFLVE